MQHDELHSYGRVRRPRLDRTHPGRAGPLPRLRRDRLHRLGALRLCLTCGHVGCCDSSPHRHAAAHHAGTGHPVMRSFEPGESWRWCYVDQRIV
jgi:hypothetical protein